MADIAAFQAQLESIRSQFADLEALFGTHSTNSANAISSALGLALATAFRLAVFIRGDYDSRPDDHEQRTSLLSQLSSESEHAHRLTSEALEVLTAIQAKASPLARCEPSPKAHRSATARLTRPLPCVGGRPSPEPAGGLGSDH